VKIAKPVSFDFNNRRSDKSGSSKDWTGLDALYSAHQDIPPDATAVLVLWHDKDGVQEFRAAGGTEACALMATRYLNRL
jgi:hypothetical protein